MITIKRFAKENGITITEASTYLRSGEGEVSDKDPRLTTIDGIEGKVLLTSVINHLCDFEIFSKELKDIDDLIASGDFEKIKPIDIMSRKLRPGVELITEKESLEITEKLKQIAKDKLDKSTSISVPVK